MSGFFSLDDDSITSIVRERLARGRLRLQQAFSCESEYSTRAHASSFARVRFECSPAESLGLRIDESVFPDSLAVGDRRRVRAAILEAVVLTLNRDFYPHGGAECRLVAIAWDDVRSSPVSFFKATTAAMERLVGEGSWKLD